MFLFQRIGFLLVGEIERFSIAVDDIRKPLKTICRYQFFGRL